MKNCCGYFLGQYVPLRGFFGVFQRREKMKVEFKDFECSYDCLKKVLVLLKRSFNKPNMWFDNENGERDDDYCLLEHKLLSKFFSLWASVCAENFQIKSRFVYPNEYIEIESDFSSEEMLYHISDDFVYDGLIAKLSIMCFLFSRSASERRLDHVISRLLTQREKMSGGCERNDYIKKQFKDSLEILTKLKKIIISEDVDGLRDLLVKDEQTSRFVKGGNKF